MVAVDDGFGGCDAPVGAQGEHLGVVVDGADLHQLAVEMENVGAAGAFVEIVDVLGYDHHFETFFEFNQGAVAVVGAAGEELCAALAVEFMDQCRVAGEAFGAADVHDGIVFPETAGVAECGYAAFGTHACTG